MTEEHGNPKVDEPSTGWNGQVSIGLRPLVGTIVVIVSALGGLLYAVFNGYGNVQNQLGELRGQLSSLDTNTIDAAIQEGLAEVDARTRELNELFDGPLIDEYKTHVYAAPDGRGALEFSSNLMTAKQGFCFLSGVVITNGDRSGSVSIYDTLIDTDGTHNWFMLLRRGHPDHPKVSGELTKNLVNTPLREQQADDPYVNAQISCIRFNPDFYGEREEDAESD